MKRVLFVPLVVGVAACQGLGGWDEALKGYQDRNTISVDAGLFALGSRCGANVDCASGQCRQGVCVDPGQSGTGPVPCGDADDCAAGRVCEPSAAEIYQCLAPEACAPTGRVCVNNSDCLSGAGCTSGCDRGMCKVLGCPRDGAACATTSDCCAGYLCTGEVADGGLVGGMGQCTPMRVKDLPLGYLCRGSEQCASGFCATGNPPTCSPPSPAGCGTVGGACMAGTTTCCGVAQCNTGVQRCVLTDTRTCLSDLSCLSNQCLAGTCQPRLSPAGGPNCRQLSLLCGDDNDCCTGLCDGAERQCTLTPLLLDGGSCVVDPGSQHCMSGDTLVCVGAHGACDATRPCCNDMRCQNGTCY